MKIQSTSNLNFNAKIINNESFNEIRSYALEHNKFAKFKQTLENIDKIRKDTFLKMDICYTNEYPTIVFSRYEYGWDPKLKQQTNNLVLKKQVDYVSTKKEKPEKFALRKFIKLGNNAPDNNMYQDVVIKKEKTKKPYCLF